MENILIVSYNFPPTIGGIETYAKEMNSYFENNSNVKFIHPKKKIPASSSILRGLSLIIFILNVYLKTYKKKYKIIQLTSYNLIFYAYLYSLIQKDTIFIINIWGLELLYGNKKGLLPKIYKKIMMNNQTNFKKISINYLVSTDASKDLLLNQNINYESIYKIPLGIKSENISYSIEIPEKYFLFVGRLVERKGLSWFSNNVLPFFPDYKLKVVGPASDKEELKKSLNKNIEYLGIVSESELLNLRKKASICIIPNIENKNSDDFEAFCFVTIESVASGSLVVASKYQGIQEAMQNGELGTLAEPSNVNSWVNKINENLLLSNSERKELIHNRQKILSKNFTWDKLFKETEKLYSELINYD